MAVRAVKGPGAPHDMHEMLQQLTLKEREKFVAEQDAARRLREAEGRVVNATEILADARRQHQQHVARLTATFDKRVRDTAARAREELREAEAARTDAEGAAQIKEESQRAAETKVRLLEHKVAQLQAQLSVRIEESERRCTMAEWENEERVRRVVSQCSERIESMTEHTRGVEDAANCAIQTVHSELEFQRNLAYMRAQGRARFKELCDLSAKRGRKEVSQRVYENCKDDILDVWHHQRRLPEMVTPDPYLDKFTAGLDLLRDGSTPTPVAASSRLPQRPRSQPSSQQTNFLNM